MAPSFYEYEILLVSVIQSNVRTPASIIYLKMFVSTINCLVSTVKNPSHGQWREVKSKCWISSWPLASSKPPLFLLRPKSKPASPPSKLTVTNIFQLGTGEISSLVLWIYISTGFLHWHISLFCKWIRPHDHKASITQSRVKRDVVEKCLRSSALVWLPRPSLGDKGGP